MRRVLLSVVCLVVGGLVGALFIAPHLRGQPPVSVAVPKELSSYRDVVKRVLPAVVSLETTSRPVARSKQKPRFDDLPIPPEFRKHMDEFQIPQQEFPNDAPHHGLGSGFFVDASGVILTNYHVVSGADQVVVHLEDGRKFVSKDIKVDPRTDLAVIRITASTPFPFLEMGDSAAAEIGDRVLAVGAPFGLTGSVTAGIVSGKGRSLQVNKYEDYVQTDAAINPGNSGGPLVTLDGKVIAVNTAIKSSNGGSQGVGLAIASNMAKDVMHQLLTRGAVQRGYLGVQVGPLDADVASRLGVADKTGVVVAKVFEGSPAAKAGIQAGDVLTALGNTPIKSAVQLQHKVAALPLKKPVEVTVFRDGKTHNLTATIEELPQDFGTTNPVTTPVPANPEPTTRVDKIGVDLGDLTPQLAKQFGFSQETTGVVVRRVDAGGLASEAEMRAGTLIVKVDNQAVATAAEARTALERGSLEKGILLQVRSAKGGLTYVVLKSA